MNLINEQLGAIIDKCKEEIKWAQACMDDMNENGGYVDDDKIELPCWLKAHKKMLEFILNPSSNAESSKI